MNSDESAVRGYRLIKATTIVITVLLVAPGIQMIGHLIGVSHANQALAQGSDGLDSSAIVQAPSAYDALEQLEAQADPGEVSPPDAFMREIGTLPDARNLRVNTGGTVVSYLVEGEEDATLKRIVDSLEDKGWTSIPLGGVCGASFVKTSGTCTWAMVACIEVEGSTSVVIRSVVS